LPRAHARRRRPGRGEARQAAGGRGLNFYHSVPMMARVETHKQLSWYSLREFLQLSSYLLREFLLRGLFLPAASLFISWRSSSPPFFCFPINKRAFPTVSTSWTHHKSSSTSSPRFVSCAHTRWKSRPPERLCPASSPARMKGGHHVFGECPVETARLLA
jgi:hypothetical protein